MCKKAVTITFYVYLYSCTYIREVSESSSLSYT